MIGQTRLARWLLLAALFGSVGLTAFAGVASAQMVVEKRCSKCNRSVAITAQVGQNCPYCGATWGSEQTSYLPGGSDGYGALGYFPMPRNSMERMAFYDAMVCQKLIERQMALDQIARQERERRWQCHLQRCQKLQEEDAARRDEIYQRVAEDTERFREHDDPQQRAKRHLTAAHRAEAERDLKTAVSYYRLVLRSAPGTTMADQAARSLARLAPK